MMMFQKLDSETVKKVVNIIIDNFEKNEEQINNLNVFPVPDGDTGTNMLLTLKSIKSEVDKLDSFNIKKISESVSFGALMGARGNSGVILSQILKGFLDVIVQDGDFDLALIGKALESSRNLAYSSVQNPTEGTMLTTIKDIHQCVQEMANGSGDKVSFSELMDAIIKETEDSVTRTTYLLPVLKEADVVDAGAQGLLVILKGLRVAMEEFNIIEGSMVKSNNKNKKRSKQKADQNANPSVQQGDLSNLNVDTDLKYTYCTELIVKGEKINVDRLKERVNRYGDSAMVVGDNKVVKIHVHTNHPHKVLRRALAEGSLHEIQINNMVDQSEAAQVGEAKKEEKVEKKKSILAVANGDGLTEIFKSIGADYIVTGGQTMNPSTYDLVKEINKIKADKIILLPNNKNIIPTAKQAKRITKKEIEIVPTVTITQGISALLNYNPDLELDENMYNMGEAINRVKSGEITTAVRDANLLVGKIKKGDYIGLYDGKIKVISDNLVEGTLDLVRDMIDENDEVITFYVGKGAGKEENKKITESIQKKFPHIEVEFHEGGQPLYPYIFSIE
ncbi:MAG: DAK2 domain-containing protein [Actinomycetota bacterium]